MKPAASAARIILAIPLAVAFFMLLSAGCIEKSKALGCCVLTNATNPPYKCLWFNMSNDRFVDLYSKTKFCDQGTQMCNVTSLDPANPNIQLEIPFCTDDTITQCIKPDCLAMVCGDFTYKPKVAPGVATAEDAADTAPANDTKETTQALYNGQCRFLPMDSKLKITMKTSKSAINDFRFGIGKDFDEYDYYHYYFPVSDRLCMTNPTGSIDRYMNYLQPGTGGVPVPYDPKTSLTGSCTTDASAAPPASFAPTPASASLPLIRDSKSYAYQDYADFAWTVTSKGWSTSMGFNLSGYYEDLGRSFYRTTLSTAYVDKFYSDATARAPFECDQSKYECLSGRCANDFYNRGVNLVTRADGTAEDPMVTDCKSIKTTTGQSMVVCYPTISANNNGGTANLQYAKVTYRTLDNLEPTDDYSHDDLKLGSTDYHNPGRAQIDYLLNPWGGVAFGFNGNSGAIGGSLFYLGPGTAVTMLPKDFNYTWMDTTGAYPPAAQIAFFDNPNVQFNGEQIIGYAVMDDGELYKTYFGQNCLLNNYYSNPRYSYNPKTPVSEADCEADCTGSSYCTAAHQSDCHDYCTARVNERTGLTDYAYVPTPGTATSMDNCIKECNSTAFCGPANTSNCQDYCNARLMTVDTGNAKNYSYTDTSYVGKTAQGSCPTSSSICLTLPTDDYNHAIAACASACNDTSVCGPDSNVDASGYSYAGRCYAYCNARVSRDAQGLIALKEPEPETPCQYGSSLTAINDDATPAPACTYTKTAVTLNAPDPAAPCTYTVKYSQTPNPTYTNKGAYKETSDFIEVQLSAYSYGTLGDQAGTYSKGGPPGSANGGLEDAQNMNNPDDLANYQRLIYAFEPLFNDTLDGYSSSAGWEDKCSPWNSVDVNDMLFAAMPWVPMYKKYLSNGEHLVLNAPALNFFRQDNVFGQDTSTTPLISGNNICDLEMVSAKYTGIGQGARDWIPIDYQALLPNTIYLLKGTTDAQGNIKIGKCNVVSGSTLPEIKTYGWCEPCTLATLAYQNITAGNTVKIPKSTLKLEPGFTPNPSNIYPSNGTPICNFLNVFQGVKTSCSSTAISDIGDYSDLFISYWGSATEVTPEGVPRTNQDAALLKERMGNYLKSGIMPVMDISDKSNWNLSAPYITETFVDSSGSTQQLSKYTEYDFQRLFGNNGAMVVIVDTFNYSSPSISVKRILNRTALVRASCSRCLTAARVYGTESGFYIYNDSLKQMFGPGSDPRLKLNVDMIVTDYDASKFGVLEYSASSPAINKIQTLSQGFLGSRFGSALQSGYVSRMLGTTTFQDRISYVLEDMEGYGHASLSYSKPVIITDFSVNNDVFWNDATQEPLFSAIIANEDQLVKSGIIGIIYQPVRFTAAGGPNNGLVNASSPFLMAAVASVGVGLAGFTSGIVVNPEVSPTLGVKTQKFCALENAVNRMAGTNPYATFVQVYDLPSVNCTLCSSTEKSQGLCDRKCDNGAWCTMPVAGAALSDYKCPDDTIAGACTLCNQTNKVYNCVKTFGNGSIIPQTPVPSTVISTDAFQDVIGGISKPDKCCLTDATGQNYTYFKKMYYTSVTAPAVFSRTGDQNQDCGIGTGKSLTDIGGFCGINLPVQNFDIDCKAA